MQERSTGQEYKNEKKKGINNTKTKITTPSLNMPNLNNHLLAIESAIPLAPLNECRT